MNVANISIQDLRRSEHFNKIIALGAAIVLIIIGTIFLIATHAATSTTAVEPELGTKSGNATTASDTSASGGKYLAFGSQATPPPPNNNISSANPCPGNPAPSKWKHIVVLIDENKTYSQVIGSIDAPYITGLVAKCGTSPKWNDANYNVDGSNNGSYNSKPHYGVYTSGVAPTVSGITTDTYSTTTNVDNIFNRMRLAGMSVKSYVGGASASCGHGDFDGDYHDPMRYYTDIGGQSTDPTTFCNTHDVSLDNFLTDANNNSLPALSFIIPNNDENMHNTGIPVGDNWAKSMLDPLFDSTPYKEGDTAVFFLWDEDTNIPNVLISPSIRPGSRPTIPSGSNPISHYSALRTWEDMLGISPYLGDSGKAPSLLNYYNGN